MTPPIQHNSEEEDWLVVLDPGWTATDTEPEPPVTALVGGWRVHEDGTAGPFEPNPQYMPLDGATPSDPIDAILRRIVAGEPLAEELLTTIQNSIIEVACHTIDQPAVTDAPDGRPCIVVATATLQKTGIQVAGWQALVGANLGDITPAGVDILINPVGSAPFRLHANRIRKQ
ncbi:type VII secretion system-associated protein [Nocardia sp. NBC_00403]|uniref:type VII secretion system-associated protein n=1 Tax=Nocardia sp. NBC_00403 TaxID=2975990 RepID=UPI002E1B5090